MKTKTQNDGRLALSDDAERKATLINLHGQHVRPGDASIRKDGEVVINGWIYIGRKVSRLRIPESIWHSPFIIGRDGTRQEVIKKFEAYILADRHLRIHVKTLQGATLCCWCAPEPCHGDVLLRLADQPWKKQKHEPPIDDGSRPQDGAFIRLQGDPNSFEHKKLVQRKDGVYLTFYTPEDPQYLNSSPVKMKATDLWQAKAEAEKKLSRRIDDGEPIELDLGRAWHANTCDVCGGDIKKGEILCESGFPFNLYICSECTKAGNIDERLEATAKRQKREKDLGEAGYTRMLIGRLIVPTYAQWKAAAKAAREEP